MRSELVLSLHAFIWEKGCSFFFSLSPKRKPPPIFTGDRAFAGKLGWKDGKQFCGPPSLPLFPQKRGTETKTNDFPPAARERRNNDLGGGEKKVFFGKIWINAICRNCDKLQFRISSEPCVGNSCRALTFKVE